MHHCHGAQGDEAANKAYEPVDAIVEPDLQTGVTLAKVVAATVAAGSDTCVTVNNKAEGSAPL